MNTDPQGQQQDAVQDDRREFQRFVVAGIKLINSETREILGEVLNLSSGGLLVLGPVRIEAAKQLSLRMQFPAFVMKEEYIDIDVFTVWCDEIEQGRFRTGMKIIPHTGQLDLFAKAINIFRE